MLDRFKEHRALIIQGEASLWCFLMSNLSSHIFRTQKECSSQDFISKLGDACIPVHYWWCQYMTTLPTSICTVFSFITNSYFIWNILKILPASASYQNSIHQPQWWIPRINFIWDGSNSSDITWRSVQSQMLFLASLPSLGGSFRSLTVENFKCDILDPRYKHSAKMIPFSMCKAGANLDC